MKTTIITALLAILSLVASAQPESVKELSMKSAYFTQEREVLIYTPAGYLQFDQTYYDVIYVFDSQDRAKFDLVHSLPEFICPEENKHFLVVGISSPTSEDYYRNADYLPMPIHVKNVQSSRGLFSDVRGYGHSGDLKKFLKHELMPYITQHYRTSGRNIGIGHSLSASFVLDCMVSDDMFDDYIAISPNYCYDEYRLFTDLEQYPWMNHQEPRFIYTSMGYEATSWDPYWQEGWRRASTFFRDKSHFPANTLVSVQQFPGYEHNPGYLPSLTEALKEYLQFNTSLLQQHISQETYPIHIELQCENMKGDVYITGNQDALANWNPKGVKMKQVNDSTCSVDLQLHLPAYFKFTRGDWDHGANILNVEPGNLIIHDAKHPIRIYRLWNRIPWTGE
jgi:hypothetical protein